MKDKLKKETKEAGYTKFMYIGPNISGRLRQNLILQGSFETIKKEFACEIEKCSSITYLIVPIHKIAKAKLDISNKNSILHKYYNDILSAKGGN